MLVFGRRALCLSSVKLCDEILSFLFFGEEDEDEDEFFFDQRLSIDRSIDRRTQKKQKKSKKNVPRVIL